MPYYEREALDYEVFQFVLKDTSLSIEMWEEYASHKVEFLMCFHNGMKRRIDRSIKIYNRVNIHTVLETVSKACFLFMVMYVQQ